MRPAKLGPTTFENIMKYVIWTLVLILLIAHQDNWNWHDDSLVWGFIPIGLFYHACISVAAGFVWFLATIFMWPKELDSVSSNASAQESN
jgi:hypothetical protein